MPLYQYQALNQRKEDVAGEISAENPDQALTRIREQGLFPTSLKEKFKKVSPRSSGPESRRPFYRPAGAGWFGISLKKLIYFTRQFAAMQDAGLPILRTLQVLQKQQRPGVLRSVLDEMGRDIQNGSTLAEAMSKHPKVFDLLYVKMVAAGEAGGVLEPILNRLAATLERTLELRRKIIKAMIYPCFILFFAMLVVILIMTIIVPMLINTMHDAGAEVSGPIGILSRVSRWFLGGLIPGWLRVLLAPGLIFLAIKFIKKLEPVRYLSDLVKMKIPLIGTIARKTVIARFARITGMLLGAGVPIVEALETSRTTTGNRVFARLLQGVEDAVRDGEVLAKPLQATRMVDLTVINMVEVGEESGELDKMLIKVADIYEEDVETLVSYMTSLLGPLLLIFVALFVGMIVVALFLSVFSIAGSQQL